MRDVRLAIGTAVVAVLVVDIAWSSLSWVDQGAIGAVLGAFGLCVAGFFVDRRVSGRPGWNALMVGAILGGLLMAVVAVAEQVVMYQYEASTIVAMGLLGAVAWVAVDLAATALLGTIGMLLSREERG
jgi:hypothetical protein